MNTETIHEPQPQQAIVVKLKSLLEGQNVKCKHCSSETALAIKIDDDTPDRFPLIVSTGNKVRTDIIVRVKSKDRQRGFICVCNNCCHPAEVSSLEEETVKDLFDSKPWMVSRMRSAPRVQQ